MRTFSESEARAVFARAARDQQAALDAANASAGLTLDELQEIGRASGLDPAFVAAAARAVALGEAEAGRGTAGPVPVSVRHAVRLAEPPSDTLWAHVAADARRTFAAKGREHTAGREREWRNGNLRVALRPDGDGSRLDVETRRAGAAPFVGAGAVVALVGALAAVLALLGQSAGGASGGALAFLIGSLVAVVLWAQQRAWAATRERQMRGLADRAAAFVPAVAPPVAVAPVVAPQLDALDVEPLDDAPEVGVASRRRDRA